MLFLKKGVHTEQQLRLDSRRRIIHSVVDVEPILEPIRRLLRPGSNSRTDGDESSDQHDSEPHHATAPSTAAATTTATAAIDGSLATTTRPSATARRRQSELDLRLDLLAGSCGRSHRSWQQLRL